MAYKVSGTTVINDDRDILNIAEVGTDLIPDTDNTRDLGSSSKAWAEIHVENLYAANAYTKSESDDRYRDSVAADILPDTDNSRDLGSSSKAWAKTYTEDLNVGSAVESDLIPDTDSSRDLGSSSKAWAEAHVGDLYLPEQASAPSTAANEGAVYTKESGGQSELFYREESDGDEVQITNGGILNAVPSGSVTWFAANSPPTGWLECDGSAISRTTYASLFSAIGTTFGVGDGSTTFDLPDLRGEFIRGWDNGRGADSGRTFGSAQGDAIRNITGTITLRNNAEGGALPTGVFARTNGSAFTNLDVLGSTGSRQVNTFDASTVVPTAAENRPRNIALLPIIKY